MTQTASHPGFFDAAERVARPLCDALRDLVGLREHDQGLRPDLRIHPTLRSRVLRGLESNHLPTILYHLPGADGLRRLVDAARKAGADPAMVRRCRERIDDYEAFLRDQRVNRDALHAMVSEQSPDARQSVVRTNAQAAHKAMSNLIGYRAEVMLTAIMIIPGAKTGSCDIAQVCGFAGLQHLRANAWFMTSGYARARGDALPARTLDGEIVREGGPTTLLESFCSQPPPRFTEQRFGRRLVHRLESDHVSLRESSTFYFGERVVDAFTDPPEGAGDSASRAMISSIIATPAKRLHFDVFVHRDVWRGLNARIDTYSTVPHGPVDADHVAERGADRIDLGATLQRFEDATDGLGACRTPRYADIIAHATARAGVRVEDLRLHRCEMIYPLHGSQIAMRFEG